MSPQAERSERKVEPAPSRELLSPKNVGVQARILANNITGRMSDAAVDELVDRVNVLGIGAVDCTKYKAISIEERELHQKNNSELDYEKWEAGVDAYLKTLPGNKTGDSPGEPNILMTALGISNADELYDKYLEGGSNIESFVDDIQTGLTGKEILANADAIATIADSFGYGSGEVVTSLIDGIKNAKKNKTKFKKTAKEEVSKDEVLQSPILVELRGTRRWDDGGDDSDITPPDDPGPIQPKDPDPAPAPDDSDDAPDGNDDAAQPFIEPDGGASVDEPVIAPEPAAVVEPRGAIWPNGIRGDAQDAVDEVSVPVVIPEGDNGDEAGRLDRGKKPMYGVDGNDDGVVELSEAPDSSYPATDEDGADIGTEPSLVDSLNAAESDPGVRLSRRVNRRKQGWPVSSRRGFVTENEPEYVIADDLGTSDEGVDLGDERSTAEKVRRELADILGIDLINAGSVVSEEPPGDFLRAASTTGSVEVPREPIITEDGFGEPDSDAEARFGGKFHDLFGESVDSKPAQEDDESLDKPEEVVDPVNPASGRTTYSQQEIWGAITRHRAGIPFQGRGLQEQIELDTDRVRLSADKLDEPNDNDTSAAQATKEGLLDMVGSKKPKKRWLGRR